MAKTPAPDTVTVLDLVRVAAARRRRGARSQLGRRPAENVAIAPDRSIALVTSALKLDPADATKTVPDDVISVIDLRASPPAVLATLHAGRQPSGVSINAAGTLALVANRAEGTVSVFRSPEGP